VIDIPPFVIELFALADVACERLDPKRSICGRRVGACGQFDPDSRVVRTPQAEQVVSDRAIDRQPFKECHARLWIDETLAIQRTDLRLGCFAGIAENQLEVGVGRDRRRALGTEHPDVHTLAHSFKKPGKGRGASFHDAILLWRLWRWSMVRGLGAPLRLDGGADVTH
jgi:hypothetical protein